MIKRFRLRTTCFLLLLLGLFASPSALSAAPANDDFEDAEVLSLSRRVVLLDETIADATDDTVTYSYEGEVYTTVFNDGIWYKWTAPANGTVTMQFLSGPVVDPYIFAEDGFELLVGREVSTSSGGLWSTNFSFEAELGKTYYLIITRSSSILNNVASDVVAFALTQSLGQLPDNYADAATIPADFSSFQGEGSNFTATTETGEPLHASVSNYKSVWLKWTAPQRSSVSFDTTDSIYDTVLAVYRGSTLSTLTRVASNDDQSSGRNEVLQSAVSFTASDGETYYFAISSKAEASGRTYFNLTATPLKPRFGSQPATIYVHQGDDGTISASAVGTGVITYKWQRRPGGVGDWVDLAEDSTYSGVTSETLTIASSTFAMNGDLFRSVATDEVGVTTSRTTKLVVTIFAPLTLTVGGSTSLDLTDGETIPPDTTYYAKGLPRGFVLDENTGEIIADGTVTPKPGTYVVTYGTTTVENGKKTNSSPTTVLIVVSALPSGLSGRFETLVEDTDEIPAGKVELTVNASSTAFSGKLTYAANAKVLSFKGKITLNSTYDVGTASVIITRGQDVDSYQLDLTIDGSTNDSPVLSASLKQLDASDLVVSTLAESTSGVQLATYTTADPTPWQGRYTLVLDDPTSPPSNLGAATIPAGTGYGLATIPASRGVLTVKGKLGDGTSLTASLSPDKDGSYRWYVKPYKTGGFFGGWLQFMPVSGSTSYKITGTSDSELYWQKSASSTDDSSYRAGFGPVALTATARTWTAPASGSNLINALNLTASSGAITSTFTGSDLPEVDTPLLPTTLTLTTANKIVVTLPVENADKFSAKVSTSTGALSGSFVLQDTRKVTIEGAFLQQPSVSSGTVIAEGFFKIPPVTKGDENVTGRIQFTAP